MQYMHCFFFADMIHEKKKKKKKKKKSEEGGFNYVETSKLLARNRSIGKKYRWTSPDKLKSAAINDCAVTFNLWVNPCRIFATKTIELRRKNRPKL